MVRNYQNIVRKGLNMKQIDRIGAEILEELSDENIHTRSNILQHEKTMLRRDEEPYIEFKIGRAHV